MTKSFGSMFVSRSTPVSVIRIGMLQPMTDSEIRAFLTVALVAWLADGAKDDSERAARGGAGGVRFDTPFTWR
jgi:hypothetical protein